MFLEKVTGIDVDRSIRFIESVVSKFNNNPVFDYSLLEDNYISFMNLKKLLNKFLSVFQLLR